MSTFYGVNNNDSSVRALSNIVTDSLRLYLDAGRNSSYPQSGSTWYDLSGNGTNVTFYKEGGTTYTTYNPGPPTFTTTRLGEFTFDGVNDWGKFTAFSSTTAFTVSAWINTTSSGDIGLLSHCSGGPVGETYGLNAGKMYHMYYTTSWQTATGTTSVNTGTWKNIVFARNGTAMVMYINGAQDYSTTLTGSTTSLVNCIGTRWGPCNSDSYGAGTDTYGTVFNGKVAILMIHTKQLSATEVLQNYNSTKSRFGL